MNKTNIVLIGMPGAGKSTVGKILAKRLSKSFVDTDELIVNHLNTALQTVVDGVGYQSLRASEEEVICDLALNNHIIATGGSAVYSQKAMDHLRQGGHIVLLDVSYETMQKRIDDEVTRGLARPKGQTLFKLYQERLPLYHQFADLVIDCDNQTPLGVVSQIQSSSYFSS